MAQSFSVTIGLSANATSSGQSPRFDHPAIGGMSINNTSSITIQYTTNGGSSWSNLSAGATQGVTVPSPSQFRLRKSTSDSYPVPVKLSWIGSTDASSSGYTVATLPAAGEYGRRAYVTDATAPTWLGALTGGGAVICPVFDNGTSWVAG